MAVRWSLDYLDEKIDVDVSMTSLSLLSDDNIFSAVASMAEHQGVKSNIEAV